MELVTVVRANLKRIGSMKAGGFGGSHKNVDVIREIPDQELESVIKILIEIAEGNGEPAGALERLKLESTWRRGEPTLVFNIQGPNTHYSEPYAECQVFPALKVGDRYFKLDEIK